MSGRDRLGSVFGPPADQANPKCERCTKSVYPQEKIVYDTVAYHKSCFKCLSCTSTISNVSSVAKMDGNIYCKVCFKKAFRLKGSYNTISSPKQGQGGDEEAVASPVAEAVVSPKPAAASTPAAPVTSFSSSSPSPDEWLRSAQRDMNSRASVVAPSEGAAATKAAEDKAAADKKAAEDKAAADKKAAEDKAAADKKAAEDKAAADKKAAEDKAAADKKAAEEAAAAKAAEEAAAEEEFVVVEKDTPADVTTVAEEAVAVVEEVKVEEPVVEEVKVEEPVVEEAAPVVEEVKVEEAAPVVEEVKIEEPVAAAEAPTVAAIPEDELAPIVEDAPVIIDDKKDIVAPLLTSSPSVDSTTSVTSPTPNARRERVASVFAAPTDLNNAKCGRCGKTAYAQERIVYDTVAYHKSCFKCQSCTSTISNVSAVAKMEGNVYCKVCFKKAFRTKGSYNTITTQGAQSPTDEAAQ